ncbi:MAG: cell division protein FtsL [Burkholderiaceae bacterium]
MIRLNVVLLLAVLASALYLVNVQYESRRLFTELDRAVSEAHRLEVDHDRLQLERREQATPMRVEKLAREKLQMRLPTPAITAYVSYSAASANTPAVAPAPAASRASVGSVQ